MPNRRTCLLVTTVLLGGHATLAAQDTTTPPAVSVLITARGFVYDSVTARPVSGASVQFAGVDSATRGKRYAAQSDSTGRFAVSGVVAGQYLVGFFDLALDTLGIQSNGQPVDIEGPNLTIMLAVPSARTLGAAFCGPAMASSPDFTLLYGKVRDAETDSAAIGGTVSITWPEIQGDSGHPRLVDRESSVSVRQGGTFAACGLPSGQALAIRGIRGTDSSGIVVVKIPKGGLTHLLLAVAPTAGRGSLAGHVYDEGKTPLAGAHAAFAAGASVREAITDVAGFFRLDSLPLGTQNIQVRALGHAPQTAIVHIASGRTNNADVVLQRVTVLPSVVSTAEVRLQQFFEDKKKTPFQAYFIEPPHPIDYPPMLTICQLLLGLPKVGVSCNGGPMSIKHSGFCGETHGFILNGKPWMADFESVDPKEILGIEYFPRNVPEQYQGFIHSMKLCPVVVWTK